MNITPAQPLDRASIEIYENYKNYEDESFLLSDSGYGDRNRIFIFAKGSVRNWINQVDKIFVDGTFKLAPKPLPKFLLSWLNAVIMSYRFYTLFYQIKRSRRIFE